jgi:hypothetical protein
MNATDVVKVSPLVARRIEAASGVIARVRELLPYRSGNNLCDVVRTEGESVSRQYGSRAAAKAIEKYQTGEFDDLDDIALEDALGRIFEAGNCEQQASVAFVELVLAGSNEMINYCETDAEPSHAFVVIGDMKRESAETLVVADSWPAEAAPCLWTHHFAFDSDLEPAASMVSDGTDLRQRVSADNRRRLRVARGCYKSFNKLEGNEIDRLCRANAIVDQKSTFRVGLKVTYTKG